MFFFFFFNDTATTEIYTLSLHDALPICVVLRVNPAHGGKEQPVLGHGVVDARPGERQAVDAAERRNHDGGRRSEEHTSELQSPCNLVCRLLLEKKKNQNRQ